MVQGSEVPKAGVIQRRAGPTVCDPSARPTYRSRRALKRKTAAACKIVLTTAPAQAMSIRAVHAGPSHPGNDQGRPVAKVANQRRPCAMSPSEG